MSVYVLCTFWISRPNYGFWEKHKLTQNYSHNLQEELGKQDKTYEATPPVRASPWASVAEKKVKLLKFTTGTVQYIFYADFQKFPSSPQFAWSRDYLCG